MPICARKQCQKEFHGGRSDKIYCCRLCKVKTKNERWRKDNIEHCREIARRFDQKRHHRRRSYSLKRKYGITYPQKQAMFADQGGKCAVVGCQSPANDGRQWNVDHHHESGRVRGILCWRCNAALGIMKESPENLLGLIKYLKDTEHVDLRAAYREIKGHE